jgi:hypothetical protein
LISKSNALYLQQQQQAANNEYLSTLASLQRIEVNMTPRPTDPSIKRRQQLHSRPTTTRQTSTYYKPSAYSFTCRGGFHIKERTKRDVKSDVNVDLETILKDVYTCNGIETKLQHVADYPLARSKDEAIRWFEGSHIASELHAGVNNEEAAPEPTKQKDTKNDNRGDRETFSSYGTTQVNILTVQEVPVTPGTAPRPMMDPFSGFGPLSPAMNPFGSLFGGLFGGFDPFNDAMSGDVDEKQSQSQNNTNRGWIRGSKSVSSSSRMGHDENGKRIATTVTKTTVVDGEGNKRTEIETVVRHLDDGGRVERKKEIHNDNNKAVKKDQVERESQAPTPAPQAASFTKESLKPPEVAMIATDCRFGLAVTDSKMDSKDPNLPNFGDATKWRKTQYFLKLGRLLPTIGVVSQYNEDEQKYDEQRPKQKSRWDKSSSDRENEEKSDRSTSNFPVPTLPDTSRTKYYLNRMGEQMIKNLQMMKLLALEMTKPDFPKKVYYSGQKILDNMGPTVERTGKLMKDVFGMWFGGRIGWGGDDGRRR